MKEEFSKQEEPITRNNSVIKSIRSMGSQSNRRASFARRSSFFNVRRLSFFRSKGTRGADVATLRGNTGAAFEGYARVVRCGDYMGNCCGFHFGTVEESTSKKPRFLLIKGSSLFVFTSEDAPTPKYAVSLEKHSVEAEAESHGHTDVLLKTVLGDTEYRFMFETKDDKEIVQRFMRAVKHAAADANMVNVKKELGHEHLLNRRASDHFANQVAKEKAKDQPEAPINVSEAMASLPSTYPV